MMLVLAIAGAREARRAPVDAVRAGTLSAIVVRRASAPRASERALKAQLAALSRLERQGLTVLPVRFGTMVASAAELRKLLAPQAAALDAALAHVRGRRQMTVRVRGERKAARRASGASYLADRVKAARLPEADVVRRAVAAFAVDERTDTDARAGFLGAVHHLVDAVDVPRYLAAVSATALAHSGALMVSGPMIPFAFVPEMQRGDNA
jgi:hypothetical protein